MIRVETVARDEDGVRKFVAAASVMREGDPSWIPPLRAAQEWSLSAENPFRGGTPVQLFLADDAGRPVARCAAMLDEGLGAPGTPAGLVGFFECAGDRADAGRAVLDAAMGWLSQQGARRALGPMDFSIWHAYRFMTRGFQTDPFLGEPRNPPLYPELFEASGFTSHARSFSWDLTREHLEGMRRAAAARAQPEAFAAAGMRLAPFDLQQFDESLSHAHGLLVEAFSDHAGFTPISREEFSVLHAGMRQLIVPELVPVMWSAERRAVGFGYLFPDYAEVFRAARGQVERLPSPPWPQPDRLLFHTVAVQKDHRRQGMVETALVGLIEEAFRRGFTRAVGALAKEGPTMYSKTGAPSREYTLYERSL
jgi:hypothetical protein